MPTVKINASGQPIGGAGGGQTGNALLQKLANSPGFAAWSRVFTDGTSEGSLLTSRAALAGLNPSVAEALLGGKSGAVPTPPIAASTISPDIAALIGALRSPQIGKVSLRSPAATPMRVDAVNSLFRGMERSFASGLNGVVAAVVGVDRGVAERVQATGASPATPLLTYAPKQAAGPALASSNKVEVLLSQIATSTKEEVGLLRGPGKALAPPGVGAGPMPPATPSRALAPVPSQPARPIPPAAGGGGGGQGGVWWANLGGGFVPPTGGPPRPPGGGAGGGGPGWLGGFLAGAGRGLGRLAGFGVAGLGIEEILSLAGTVIDRGQKGANLILQSGRLATAGGFSGEQFRGMANIGALSPLPPAQWAAFGIGQRQALRILQQYPFVARSAADAMRLPSIVGAYSLAGGALSRYSPEAVASMMGRVQQLMPAGGLIPGAEQSARLLAGISQSLANNNLPVDSGLRAWMAQGQSLASTTMSPINMGGLFNFQSGFQQVPGASPAQGIAAASRIANAQASSEGMSSVMTNPFRYYLNAVLLTKYRNNLGGLFGQKALAALTPPGSPGAAMLAALKGRLKGWGPSDPEAIAIFSELKASLARSNPGAERAMLAREENFLTPYAFGMNDPASRALFGKWFENQSTLEDYYSNKIGAGKGLGVSPPGAMESWGLSSTGPMSALLGPYRKEYTGLYRAALLREGITKGHGMIKDILAAAAETGLSPLAIGGVAMVESKGGLRNGPSSAGAVGAMQLLPSGAIAQLAQDKVIDLGGKTPAQYAAGLTQAENVRLGAIYLKMHGGIGGYNPRGGAAYVQSVTDVIARGTGAPVQFVQNYGGAAPYGPTVESAGNAGDVAAFYAVEAAAGALTDSAHQMSAAADAWQKALNPSRPANLGQPPTLRFRVSPLNPYGTNSGWQ